MLLSEARVETDRPGRYLAQLGRHLSAKGRHLAHRAHHPTGPRPEQIRLDWSTTHGVLTLPWGRCTLHAAPDALVLRAEAEDAQGMRRLQDLMTSHLERFGRREGLRVRWRDGEAAPDPAAPTARRTRTADTAGTPTPPPWRRQLTWAGVTALVLVAVAVHLGSAGAVLSGPRWTAWAVGAVLAVAVVKIAALTFLGRHAHRRGRRRTG
ncbi:DUF2218 domain-containing protein [Streptomyces bullii]|uniref:DUF2218 domain-containing protein n=1 Tax=Streptomyces bullii TaxID=349910 RepID=A0ABW0UP69_9ACTN